MARDPKDTRFAELKDEISQLKEENHTLRDDLKEANKKSKLLQEQVDYLSKKLYGTSSEKIVVPTDQFNLFDEAEVECNPEEIEEYKTTLVQEHTRKQKITHEEKFKDLKVNKIIVDLPEEEKNCPVCGEEMEKIGETLLRREVVFVPARCEINEYYGVSYGCPKCKEGIGDTESAVIVKSKAKPALIEKSYASPSVVSMVMYQKFGNGMPLARQEKDWKQYGLELSRTTMANWIIYCAERYLKPMYDRLHALQLQREFLMADETRIQVLHEPGRRAETDSFMWVYRTGEDGLKPIVTYEYTETRNGENAAKYLEGFQGYLETDGYAGYNKVDGIIRCSCWAHIRRYFVDAIPKGKQYDMKQPAVQGVSYCDRLFRKEKAIDAKCGNDYEKRKELRLKEEKEILEAFWSWAEKQVPIKGSRLDKAITYALNRKETAMNYLKDGRCSFSNNLSENAVRPFAVGRKNWLFSTSQKGAQSSAIVYTIVEMARMHGLVIHDYLNYLLEQRPDKSWSDDELDRLLPWSEEVQQLKNGR